METHEKKDFPEKIKEASQHNQLTSAPPLFKYVPISKTIRTAPFNNTCSVQRKCSTTESHAAAKANTPHCRARTMTKELKRLLLRCLSRAGLACGGVGAPMAAPQRGFPHAKKGQDLLGVCALPCLHPVTWAFPSIPPPSQSPVHSMEADPLPTEAVALRTSSGTKGKMELGAMGS